MTTLMRFIWMAPGYAEGNYRTNLKALFQWGKGGPGQRSRVNIVNSLAISAMLATLGTILMTKKWPEKPEKMQDVRDLFKIDTGYKDDKDRKIMIDLLTYDKDYWEIYGKLIFGDQTTIVPGLFKRAGGMKSALAELATDMGMVMQGKALVDWKNDEVYYFTDPGLVKMMKFVKYELERITPISKSVADQARKRGANDTLAYLMAAAGLRPAYTEAEVREREQWKVFYDLRNRREDLYRYISTLKKPIEAVENYNKQLTRLISNRYLSEDVRGAAEKLFIKIDPYIRNQIKKLKSASTPVYQKKTIEKKLKNLGVTEDQYQSYLRMRTERPERPARPERPTRQ